VCVSGILGEWFLRAIIFSRFFLLGWSGERNKRLKSSWEWKQDEIVITYRDYCKVSVMPVGIGRNEGACYLSVPNLTVLLLYSWTRYCTIVCEAKQMLALSYGWFRAICIQQNRDQELYTQLESLTSVIKLAMEVHARKLHWGMEGHFSKIFKDQITCEELTKEVIF